MSDLRGKILKNGDMILDVKPEQFIMLNKDGDVYTARNTDYYYIRYLVGDGNRFSYTFNEDNHLQETFDRRIINCTFNGRIYQTRPEFAEEICYQIRKHMDGDETAVQHYIKILERAEKETPMYDILDMFLDQMTGIIKTKKGYKVHGDKFLVDLKGRSHFRGNDGKYHYLCLVMPHNPLGILPKPGGGSVKVNDLTMTIISKVFFLLKPKMHDHVFTNQIRDTPLLEFLEGMG